MLLYNSLTQQKEHLKPLKTKEIKLYVCGITPYDTTHLGHAFLYTFFDALNRYLTYKDYTVTYIQNVTDIDDDILRKAKENALHISSPFKGEDEGEGKKLLNNTTQHQSINPNKLTNWQELGQFWTDKFLTDLKTLNIQMPTKYVKATDSIPTIVTIIEKLLKDGFAYEKDGIIFFRTTKDPEYGKLSHFKREQMLLLSKERGANPDDPRKEDPLDFILWQTSAPDEPGWDGPKTEKGQGQVRLQRYARSIAGRPGWHIECTAMNYDFLGPQIDIHGGGRDLIYPHHESEIAQSEAFTGKKPFSQIWMHAAMVMYQGEKMSKSLGNLIMVSDLLKKYSPNAIRYVLLSHHYRTPWEFTESELPQAEEKLVQIKKALNVTASDEGAKPEPLHPSFLSQFESAMEDDCNTPQALTLLTQLAQNPSKTNQSTIKTLFTTLGFTI